jgi:hypothetical protein
MAQQLRALTLLPEVLSSIPSTHMVVHNHLQWDQMPHSGVSEDSYSVLIYIKQINNSLKKRGGSLHMPSQRKKKKKKN